MKKIFFFWVFVLVVFLLILEAKTGLAGVTVNFDFQGVSETYIKFTYEFGSEFGLRMKEYRFFGEYTVRILERIAKIRYQDGAKEGLVIGVFINKEKRPFLWIRTEDLNSEEKIKKKGKEFSDKIFKRLKELEKKKKSIKILV